MIVKARKVRKMVSLRKAPLLPNMGLLLAPSEHNKLLWGAGEGAEGGAGGKGGSGTVAGGVSTASPNQGNDGGTVTTTDSKSGGGGGAGG